MAFLGMQPGTALWDKAGDGVAHLSVARRMGMLAYWGVQLNGSTGAEVILEPILPPTTLPLPP